MDDSVVTTDAVVSDVADVGGANVAAEPVVDVPQAPIQQPVVVESPKPEKHVKAKAKLAKKVPTKKTGRGRPPVYTGKVLTYIVGLVRRYGQTDARKILNAGNGKRDESLKSLRDQTLVHKPLNISMPTLVKIAKTAKIECKRGRRAEGSTVLAKTLEKLAKKAA